MQASLKYAPLHIPTYSKEMWHHPMGAGNNLEVVKLLVIFEYGLS